jgi:hypothetical protein
MKSRWFIIARLFAIIAACAVVQETVAQTAATLVISADSLQKQLDITENRV